MNRRRGSLIAAIITASSASWPYSSDAQVMLKANEQTSRRIADYDQAPAAFSRCTTARRHPLRRLPRPRSGHFEQRITEAGNHRLEPRLIRMRLR